MIMKAKYGEIEDIEIKVSMVDAVEVVPKPGDDSTGENVRLHISLLVCISKENYSDAIECWCSAWPDSLVIHELYVRTNDNKRPSLYKGPHFGYDYIFNTTLKLLLRSLVWYLSFDM